MKQHKWIVGAAALAMACGTVVPVFADTPAPAPKVAKPQPRPGAKEIEHIEAVQGTPLTEDQKNQISAAFTARETAIQVARAAYGEALMKALGTNGTDWMAKEKAYAAAERLKRQQAAAAAAAPATTTPATPATTTAAPK